MKIAFVGKGGSGKTTHSSLFGRFCAEAGRNTLLIDADINQHLSGALGIGADEVDCKPTLSEDDTYLRKVLCGNNKLIKDISHIVKTTPPGPGSHLVRIKDSADPIIERYGIFHNGFCLIRCGFFDDDDIGLRCYHSKQAWVELLLSHISDDDDDRVIIDMTAGADSFASGIFAKFDVTFVVVEPTLKSISVFRQYSEHAKCFGIQVFAVANKIVDFRDRDFFETQLGDKFIGGICISDFVRNIDKGVIEEISKLETENLSFLKELDDFSASCKVNYLEKNILMHQLHRRYAAGKPLEKYLLGQIES